MKHRVGYVLGGLAIVFLAFDTVIKLMKLPVAVGNTVQLGYSEHVVFWLGLIELICLSLYLIPRTAVVGAILLTGYLGGAVATHVRVGSPLFTHVLFPVYVGALIWGSIYLRDLRLRSLVPFRSA